MKKGYCDTRRARRAAAPRQRAAKRKECRIRMIPSETHVSSRKLPSPGITAVALKAGSGQRGFAMVSFLQRECAACRRRRGLRARAAGGRYLLAAARKACRQHRVDLQLASPGAAALQQAIERTRLRRQARELGGTHMLEHSFVRDDDGELVSALPIRLCARSPHRCSHGTAALHRSMTSAPPPSRARAGRGSQLPRR